MNELPEKNIDSLLTEVSDIIKSHKTQWEKTGEKFNLLKAAGVTRKEVPMCRVLAALLNPRGDHYLRDLYLKLFWKRVIDPKAKGRVKQLDYNKTRIITEDLTNAGRRIDIVITDGDVYLPIEVKIDAEELPEQLADYACWARARNKGKNIPVFFLTKDGHAPKTAQGYACEPLSWSRDMVGFLKACIDETPSESLMRSNIAQFMGAIKSFCGEFEDAKMKDDVLDLILAGPDSLAAAKEIQKAVTASQRGGDFDNKAKILFETEITKRVKEGLEKEKIDAEYIPRDDDWDYINISIKDPGYILQLNYDWRSVALHIDTVDLNEDLKKLLCLKMAEWTCSPNEQMQSDGLIFIVSDKCRYPGLDDDLYFYRLYKLYAEHPEKAAEKIISFTRELQNVKV